MRKLVFIAVLLAVGVSCHEDEKFQPPPVAPDKIFEPSADIEFNGDYLVFPTPESFKKTFESLMNSDPQTVRVWSTQLGFNSVRMIYEKALEEQEKYLSGLLAVYQSFPKGDPRLKAKPTIVQPDYVKENADLLAFDKDGIIRRSKISNYDITALINKDGLVKVAGHLFQYNEDNIKIIVGGDAAKIPNLATVNETNEELNIVVNPVKHEYVKDGQKQLTSETGRVWYDYSNQSMHWVNPDDCCAYEYYFNYEIHISIYYYPIYDTTPICEPEGCGQARSSEAMDCNCYYPITGYTGYSRFENHMETRKVWMGQVNTQHNCRECTISVDYEVDNGGFMNHASHTREEYVNTYLTVYDNTPAIEFTCGDHDFYADMVHFSLARTVNVSWCD